MGVLWDVFRIGTSLMAMAISAAYYKKRDMPTSAEVKDVIDESMVLINDIIKKARDF
jgi:hypothetical protein